MLTNTFIVCIAFRKLRITFSLSFNRSPPHPPSSHLPLPKKHGQKTCVCGEETSVYGEKTFVCGDSVRRDYPLIVLMCPLVAVVALLFNAV